MAPPCVVANELSVQAFETRAVPRVERALPSRRPGMLTLVSESSWVPDAGWVEHNHARGWVVATPAP